MSLINDALKKAQRLRQEQEAAHAAGQVGRPDRRGAGMSTQVLIVLGAAAAVLVVVSVVATVVWLNRAPEAKPGTASAKPGAQVLPASLKAESLPAAANTATPASTPPPVASTPPPNAAPPVNAPIPAPGGAVALRPAEPAVAITVQPATAPPANSPVTAATPPATSPASLFRERVNAPAPLAVPAPPTLPQPDPRIQKFVDSIKLSMVRAAGPDSRVMVNDHVYRINEMVDRTLGVKLVKVEPGQLTFADANGFTYTHSY